MKSRLWQRCCQAQVCGGVSGCPTSPLCDLTWQQSPCRPWIYRNGRRGKWILLLWVCGQLACHPGPPRARGLSAGAAGESAGDPDGWSLFRCPLSPLVLREAGGCARCSGAMVGAGSGEARMRCGSEPVWTLAGVSSVPGSVSTRADSGSAGGGQGGRGQVGVWGRGSVLSS